MLFAVIGDVVYQALIGAVVTIVLAWMQFRVKATIESTAKAAAVKAEEVKEVLEEATETTDKKLQGLAEVAEEAKKTGDAIHVLVNSSMMAQLKISAVALRRIADLTKHAGDIAAAELAEKLLHEHEKKQAAVDAKGH